MFVKNLKFMSSKLILMSYLLLCIQDEGPGPADADTLEVSVNAIFGS